MGGGGDHAPMALMALPFDVAQWRMTVCLLWASDIIKETF